MIRYFLLSSLLIGAGGLGGAGCGFGDDGPKMGTPDAQVDAMVDAPTIYTDHLLLSEVYPNGGEFVEIWNPTTRTISLTNYYLADIGNYWKLPSVTPLIPTQTDFYAQFPTGATIAPGAVVTVAFAEATFTAEFAPVVPTFALDAVAGDKKMERVVLASAALLPTISNAGEYITLFYWDGSSDLVKDVDIVLASNAIPSSGANTMMPKEPVDGPDSDATASSYKLDNGLILTMAQTTEATGALSYKRRTLETGVETQDGTGNGITGDDETSEAFKSSWDGDVALPLSVPTPGTPPAI